jgi:hypothetical protein
VAGKGGRGTLFIGGRAKLGRPAIRRRHCPPPLPILPIPRRQRRIADHHQVLGVVALRRRGEVEAAGDDRGSVEQSLGVRKVEVDQGRR